MTIARRLDPLARQAPPGMSDDEWNMALDAQAVEDDLCAALGDAPFVAMDDERADAQAWDDERGAR